MAPRSRRKVAGDPGRVADLRKRQAHEKIALADFAKFNAMLLGSGLPRVDRQEFVRVASYALRTLEESTPADVADFNARRAESGLVPVGRKEFLRLASDELRTLISELTGRLQ